MDHYFKFFNAFFVSKKNKLYFNELKDLTSMSNSSLQNILNKLLEQNIIFREKTKSNVFYGIKDKKFFSLMFSFLALKKFESLNFNVKISLKNFLEKVKMDSCFIVLFGSSVNNSLDENSDIDILLVYNKKIKSLDKILFEINSSSLYPLSVFQCSLKDFRKNDDKIIIQAKNTGFPIFNEQRFYEEILYEY